MDEQGIRMWCMFAWSLTLNPLDTYTLELPTEVDDRCLADIRAVAAEHGLSLQEGQPRAGWRDVAVQGLGVNLARWAVTTQAGGDVDTATDMCRWAVSM